MSGRFEELVGEALRATPAPDAAPALVARTLVAAERRLAEREEIAWNSAAVGFAVGFAWVLGGVGLLFVQVLGGRLALGLGLPAGSVVAWLVAYTVAGWVAGGAAAVLLGRGAAGEGRTS